MSNRLRQYLYEHYAVNGYRSYKKLRKDHPIQIDDQDDSDALNEFCNIFVTVGRNNTLVIELSGGMPVTREMADFAEIYSGIAEPAKSRIVLNISPTQIEALMDLAARIRRTAELGHTVNNPNWDKLSARTISSIYRFVRIIKEYQELRSAGLV
jgi:hypothetical protein